MSYGLKAWKNRGPGVSMQASIELADRLDLGWLMGSSPSKPTRIQRKPSPR